MRSKSIHAVERACEPKQESPEPTKEPIIGLLEIAEEIYGIMAGEKSLVKESPVSEEEIFLLLGIALIKCNVDLSPYEIEE